MIVSQYVDGEIGADALRGGTSTGHAADVWRDDHHVALLVGLLDVADHYGRAVEIVRRDVEEALDLRGVQIERDDAVDAGGGDEVGNELGRDGSARCRFAVLPGVAE